jgi:hypothetical protein
MDYWIHRKMFILGYSLGRSKQEDFNHIITTMVKLLALRKLSNTSKNDLNAVYSLMMEQDWNAVRFANY